ncbi:MAG: ABC transporter substrate-binding protein [Alphaproteobacteria bacterium]
MAKLQITVATDNYDRTRAIRDGRVAVDGCEVVYLNLEPEELFFRTVRYKEFDVCEMSFNTYMMQRSRGIADYIAIPVFLSRAFRHSGIYIRTDKGIKTPADLRGKTIGLPEYQITAVVWLRGMLQDEYGVAPSQIKWRTGGAEQPGREERAPLKPPPGIDLAPIPPGKTLSGMLETGELDAIMLPRTPSAFVKQAPNVARLFPDYRAAEQAYFRKTKLHPIMHVLGVKTALAERYPWLPGSLFKAFRQAKDLAIADLERIITLYVTMPWIGAELAATRAVLGHDIWPYGVAENRHEIETLLRYSLEQGLSEKAQTVEELFAPSTLATSKI